MKIPQKIQREIKGVVYRKADAHGYMHRGRADNGLFMENLVRDPEVGGRLGDFMTRDLLKTYIKDALLNRYAKDKTAAVLDTDVPALIEQKFGCKSDLIERRDRLSLYGLEGGGLALVSVGTLIKWETALRRALEFYARAPGLSSVDVKLAVLVILATHGKALTGGDKQLIEKSLAFVNVSVAFIASH